MAALSFTLAVNQNACMANLARRRRLGIGDSARSLRPCRRCRRRPQPTSSPNPFNLAAAKKPQELPPPKLCQVQAQSRGITSAVPFLFSKSRTRLKPSPLNPEPQALRFRERRTLAGPALPRSRAITTAAGRAARRNNRSCRLSPHRPARRRRRLPDLCFVYASAPADRIQRAPSPIPGGSAVAPRPAR